MQDTYVYKSALMYACMYTNQHYRNFDVMSEFTDIMSEYINTCT
jgi:hypothetical protein